MPEVALYVKGLVALIADLALAVVKYLLVEPSVISSDVKVTFGPYKELTLVTELGVANSTQLDKVLDGVALNTKFLFESVRIAILPITKLDNDNIAASLVTTLAL